MKLSRIFKKAAVTLAIAFAAVVSVDSGLRFATRDKPQPLKSGDIEFLKNTFQNSIDYSKVRIARHRISFLQSPQRIMCIGNTIYWPKENHTHNISYMLSHEAAHVWQNQNDIRRTGVGGAIRLWLKTFDYKSSYHYSLDTTRRLDSYNMEQQADMLADYNALSGAVRTDSLSALPPNTSSANCMHETCVETRDKLRKAAEEALKKQEQEKAAPSAKNAPQGKAKANDKKTVEKAPPEKELTPYERLLGLRKIVQKAIPPQKPS